MGHCIFCRIAAGEIPSNIVHQDDLCIAFKDINPQAPVHLLVVPREHIRTTSELQESHEPLAGHLLRVGAMLAREAGVAESGFRLVFNTNEDAGQTVFHIHLHVLGGRMLGWPPG